MKRMFSKEELEAIIKNVTDIEEVKSDVSELKEDFTPVLLWENATPDVSFAGATITIADKSPYKYIKIIASIGSGNNILQVFTFKNTSNAYSSSICVTDEGVDFWGRQFTFISNTSMSFDDAKSGNTTNNNRVIPVAIYGNNIL